MASIYALLNGRLRKALGRMRPDDALDWCVTHLAHMSWICGAGEPYNVREARVRGQLDNWAAHLEEDLDNTELELLSLPLEGE